MEEIDLKCNLKCNWCGPPSPISLFKIILNKGKEETICLYCLLDFLMDDESNFTEIEIIKINKKK